jgi:hypothetical protein
MHLRQMFPSQSLDAQDLQAFCEQVNSGQPVAVTIEKLDYKTKQTSEIGKAEIDYFLYVREFTKPFKISKGRAMVIAHVLGTEETDQWVGRTVMIKAGTTTYANNIYWVVQPVIDPPPHQSSLPPKQDITGMQFQNRPRLGAPAQAPAQTPSRTPAQSMSGPQPLGMDEALRMFNELHLRNVDVNFFRGHIQKVAPQLAADISGHPPTWPGTVRPWARQLVSSMPITKAALSSIEQDQLRKAWTAPEVIDPKTGQVITSGSGDDDIPF